jgi:hypothetical protein
MDMMAVLERIAVPRPNHSDLLDMTSSYLNDMLTEVIICNVLARFPHRVYTP